MEDILKEALGTISLKSVFNGNRGCINDAETYMTDEGTVFVKSNRKAKARQMFDGEFESLITISATQTVKVPAPIKVLDIPTGGALFVMEYVDMKGLRGLDKQLGEQLAALHLHNLQLDKKNKQDYSFIGQKRKEDETQISHENQFGFHVPTSCGYLAQDNTWADDWVIFYARQRLEHQLNLIEKSYGDREVRALWSKLQLEIPGFFKGIKVKPSLLHGDLWNGNVGATCDGPIIYDPASFYGHHEFELAIVGMFGGFSKTFYEAYHQAIPKAPGFDNRHKLYQLFHYLNHWNHFGGSYKASSIEIMKGLTQ